MSTPTYTITRDEDSGLATITVIFNDGTTLATNSTNGNYKDVVQAVAINEADEAEVRDLLRPVLSVGKALRSLSERVLFDDGNIYFDGDVIDSSLAKHIVRIMAEGGAETKWRALVNFMEKLYANPSTKSIASLYEFLTRQNFTILPDGDFLAYKGLNRDGTSIHAGFGIVDGVAFTSAHLKNNKGSVIEIPRSKVDPDTARGCSTGLHAGSYAYAKGFAQGMLVTVKINPRDVVSVPDDCSYQKIRTARYVVLDQTEVEYAQTTYRDADNDWTEDEDFDGDEDAEWEDEDADRDEVESALEAFRAENIDHRGQVRDFEQKPLIESEANVLRDAEEWGIPLDGEEEDALDAFDDAEREQLAQTEPVKSNLAAGLAQSAAGDVAELTAPAASHSVPGLTKPSANEFAKQLQAEIDGEEDIVLGFDYTRGDGSQVGVERFAPSEIERRGSDLLVTGQNAEGQWRSYYYSRMENLSVRDAEAAPKHAQ